MKTSEVTCAELEGAAARAGATVEYRQVVNGSPVARVICPDGWGAARLLAEFCADDVGRPNLRAAARALLRPGMTDEDYARTVQDAVKETIRFAYEEGEIFQSTAHTAKIGVGDCDDHARVVVGLLRAGGVPARLAFLSPPGGQPAHVCAQAFLDGGWVWLETTCDAGFGEDPFHAAQRLKLLRGDIIPQSEVRTMGDVAEVRSVESFEASEGIAGVVGPSPLSDAALVQGARMSSRLGISWPDLLKVMNNESGLSPIAQNPGGAFGLIQFDPPLANLPLTAEGQLPFVESFLREGARHGLKSVARIYQDIFLPGTVAVVKSGVLVRRGGTGFGGQEASFYASNIGFDRERKGYITVEDLGRVAEAKARLPNSPYQRALARLRVVAPESIPTGGGAVVALSLFTVGVLGLVEWWNPGVVRVPLLAASGKARRALGV